MDFSDFLLYFQLRGAVAGLITGFRLLLCATRKVLDGNINQLIWILLMAVLPPCHQLSPSLICVGTVVSSRVGVC